MGGYIANFTVYTMAMIGLICFAVFVYKKFTDSTMRSNNTRFLSVEDSLSLNPRKTLHVVRAGNEKFLIASDVDRTTLISKLEWNKTPDLKNLDRFKQIPLAQQEIEPDIQIQESFRNEPVKFEQVDFSKRPVERRMRLDNRAGMETVANTKPQKNSMTTMREMAQKINSL